MGRIIAGRFEQQSQAEDAIAAMLEAGFEAGRIASFYVNPAGQHDLYPLGGDRDKSPGAEETGAGRASGMAAGGAIGAALGAATSPVTGPIGPVTGAFVGAHIGSLVGSLEQMKEDGTGVDENPTPVRHAGMLVAVSVPDDTDDAAEGQENRIVDVLRSVGAVEVERADGTIVNGDWEDFDPIAPPVVIERMPPQ